MGIGTHIRLDRLLGLNYEYEERFPGFHVGLGVSESDEAAGGPRRTDHHLDLVLLKSTIHFDDVCVMRDGRFTDIVMERAAAYRR